MYVFYYWLMIAPCLFVNHVTYSQNVTVMSSTHQISTSDGFQETTATLKPSNTDSTKLPTITGVPNSEEFDPSVDCNYAPGFNFENATVRDECCAQVTKNYRRGWTAGNLYLTTYLESLRAWNCSEFREECSDPTFAQFSPYTEMVYQYFCNYDGYLSDCSQQLTSNVSSWNDTLLALNSTQFSDDQLLEPCTQLAVYESQQLKGTGSYYEIIHPAITTCGMVWYGFDAAEIEPRHITPWKIAPTQ